MKIIGVEVNNQILTLPNNPNSTNCYNAFMRYCIDNHFVAIAGSEVLNKRFKLTPEYPDFNRAIDYNRVISYNGLYYTDWMRTDGKERAMRQIADELGIELTLHIIQ